MTLDPAASGPEPSGHADPDRLADMAAGGPDPRTAHAVRAHLTSCQQCAEPFTLITLHSGIAAFLPVEPIPAEVVARVEAALYREPPLQAAGVGAAARSHH